MKKLCVMLMCACLMTDVYKRQIVEQLSVSMERSTFVMLALGDLWLLLLLRFLPNVRL